MREDAEELYLEMGMKGIELKEAVDLHVKKQIAQQEGPNLFNQCLEEESQLIGMMGKKFREKIQYIKQVAQNEV